MKKPAANIFFLLLPFVFFLLFYLVIQKNPLDFHLVFSDEVDYWVEAATLSKRGLFSPNAGYFGYGFSNYARYLYFGAHGFFSLIPYAVYGIIAPRAYAAVLVFNALCMGISLSSAYYLIGSFRKTLAIALPLFAFYPFFLYYQTGMLETLNYTGSLLLAVLCVNCFSSEARQKIYLNLYFWMVILFSLFRLSNFVLIIPALFLEIYLKKEKVFHTLLKYGVAGAIVALLSIIFAATYPWGFLGELGKANNLIGLVLDNSLANIKLFFNLSAGYSLEILPRFLFLAWLIFLCIYYITTRKQNARKINLFLLSLTIVMIALFLLNITLYDIGSFRDLRVFSPVLVFSMISFFLTVRTKNSGKWTLGLAIVFLLASNYVVVKECNLAWDLFIARRYEAVSPPTILKYIRYNPEARNRWENTVYVDLQAYSEVDWQNYDPGIGLMVLGPEEMAKIQSSDSVTPFNAKYIISRESIQKSNYELIKSEQNVYLYVHR